MKEWYLYVQGTQILTKQAIITDVQKHRQRCWPTKISYKS